MYEIEAIVKEKEDLDSKERTWLATLLKQDHPVEEFYKRKRKRYREQRTKKRILHKEEEEEEVLSRRTKTTTVGSNGCIY